MTEKKKSPRLNALVRDYGVGLNTLVEFLAKHGFEVEANPSLKIEDAAYDVIVKEWGLPNKKGLTDEEKSPAPSRAPKSTGGKKTVKKTTPAPAEVEAVATTVSDIVETELPKVAVTVKGKISLEQDTPAEEVAPQPTPSQKKAKDEMPEGAVQGAEVEPTAEQQLETLKELDKKQESLPQKPLVENEEKNEEKASPRTETKPVSPSVEKQASEPIATATNASVKETTGAEVKIEKEVVANDKPEVKSEQVVVESPKESPAPSPTVASEMGNKLREPEFVETRTPHVQQPKVLRTIDLTEQSPKNGKRKQYEAKVEAPVESPKPVSQHEEKIETAPVVEAPKEGAVTEEVFRTNVTKLAGTTVVGKIDLASLEEKTRRKPEASATPGGAIQKRRRRKKIGSSEDAYPSSSASQGGGSGHSPQQQNFKNNTSQQRDGDRRNKKKLAKKPEPQPEITRDVIEERYKETRARITARENARSKVAKLRKEKRSLLEVRREEENLRNEEARRTLQVSEFVSVNELAGMMEVPVTEVIDACLSLDLMVSINQRLDGEALVLVADEFGFKVEFVGPTLEEELSAEEDNPEDLVPRIPIFTVFGHVDHGKTSLCNFITKRQKQEEGGITQSITADIVTLPGGERMVLVDTPGHEAFTAMRSRGAKIADVAIIVISAVEGVQPQTVEVMNHAASNGVHMVFAINKIDMPEANPRRVMDELANMNYLVEEYGGKYQCQEISARQGTNVDKLLEKVLLEASLMELKANPKRHADAVVLEVSQKLGLGACVNVIVRNGTLHKGDRIVAGQYYGRVRSLHLSVDNNNSKSVLSAEPSLPVMVIGLNGKPQAGDHLLVVDTDKQARDMATKIGRIRRLQKMNSEKPITLDELGRRIALGDFKELKLIIKADVDGSVEALSDALLKLSTPEINVAIIYKGVGQITETDVSLAKSSDAVIVGFQVRPNMEAKRVASENGIDIHLYSVIYDAIEEVRQAMEGMLTPEVKEEILGTAEVKELFHISKVGTIAGCMVREGKILRGSKVRIIRDGIVVYTSELLTLKHYKDEAKEVTVGQDCGMSVKNYNDIKVGDLIEAYRETEVKRTLS